MPLQINTDEIKKIASKLDGYACDTEQTLYMNQIEVKDSFLGDERSDSAQTILAWFEKRRASDQIALQRARDKATNMEINADQFLEQQEAHRTGLNTGAGI